MADQGLNPQLVAATHFFDLRQDGALPDGVVGRRQIAQIDIVGEQGKLPVVQVSLAKGLHFAQRWGRPLGGGAGKNLQALGADVGTSLKSFAGLASGGNVGTQKHRSTRVARPWGFGNTLAIVWRKKLTMLAIL